MEKSDAEKTRKAWKRRTATSGESSIGNFPHHRAKTRKGKNTESEYRWESMTEAEKDGDYSKEDLSDLKDHLMYQDRDSYSRRNYKETSKKDAKSKESKRKDELAKKAKMSVLKKKIKK